MTKPTIGVLTGGGDCPGLNTVLDSVAKSLEADHRILGFIKGFEGLFNREFILLEKGVTSRNRFDGGTVLKSVNTGHYPGKTGSGSLGSLSPEVLERTINTYKEESLECLLVLGGDGTLSVAKELSGHGLNIIGIPKSIDNDVFGTDLTFGFLTAVDIAQEALDRLETTSRSHERVMILEVMGRNTGWIGLYSGIAGGANIILIPEIPFSYQKVVEVIRKRKKQGKSNTLIVISEGATSSDGQKIYAKTGGFSSETLLGGAGDELAGFLNKQGIDSRSTRLGHIQRGGSPSSFDRILSVQMGAFAGQMVRKKEYGKVVSYCGGSFRSLTLSHSVSKLKVVDPEDTMVKLASDIGISFGV